jgi:hypothetical protein
MLLAELLSVAATDLPDLPLPARFLPTLVMIVVALVAVASDRDFEPNCSRMTEVP